MIIVQDLLDYATPWKLPDVYLFTGNPIRRKDGGLVMGRGAAKAVRDAYPGIDKRINTSSPVAFTEIAPDQYIGYFQVKHHWREEAQLDLIEESSWLLRGAALMSKSNTFHMNYPGVGNGKLAEADVEPLLSILPDNVIIYR